MKTLPHKFWDLNPRPLAHEANMLAIMPNCFVSLTFLSQLAVTSEFCQFQNI